MPGESLIEQVVDQGVMPIGIRHSPVRVLGVQRKCPHDALLLEYSSRPLVEVAAEKDGVVDPPYEALLAAQAHGSSQQPDCVMADGDGDLHWFSSVDAHLSDVADVESENRPPVRAYGDTPCRAAF